MALFFSFLFITKDIYNPTRYTYKQSNKQQFEFIIKRYCSRSSFVLRGVSPFSQDVRTRYFRGVFCLLHFIVLVIRICGHENMFDLKVNQAFCVVLQDAKQTNTESKRQDQGFFC